MMLMSLTKKFAFRKQARGQDLEKGGGLFCYFERVRKVQTTLTRIFIVLESVSHGFSDNQISEFQTFYLPKVRRSPKKKKKKGLHRF